MEFKKITEEELQELQGLQENMNNLTIELGSIILAEKEIEKRKDTANATYKVLIEMQEIYMKKIRDTYGNGSIDINTGEIIIYDNKQ